MRLWVALAVCAVLSGCAGTESKPLMPGADRIELVTREPDRDQFEFLGDVEGTAKGDLSEATQNARNDIRNRAARLGATLVTIDTNTNGNAMDWTGRNQVVLNGRAFRSKRGATTQPAESKR